MSIVKIHRYSSHVTRDPLMPEYVRDQYAREGLRGTLCGYVRPSVQVPYQASDAVTCKLCLRELAKQAAAA